MQGAQKLVSRADFKNTNKGFQRKLLGSRNFERNSEVEISGQILNFEHFSEKCSELEILRKDLEKNLRRTGFERKVQRSRDL